MANHLVENYSIDKFYANVIRHEFSRQHQWRITNIRTGNDGLNGFIRSENPETHLLVESANIPARSINNVPVNFHGIDFNLPGNAKYTGSDSWNTTWRVDQKLNLRRVMEEWQTFVFNDRISGGSITRANDASLTMTLFDQFGMSHSTYTLYGIYPTEVGALDYNVGTDGDIVTMDVTFAYHYWDRGGVTAANMNEPINGPEVGGPSTSQTQQLGDGL